MGTIPPSREQLAKTKLYVRHEAVQRPNGWFGVMKIVTGIGPNPKYTNEEMVTEGLASWDKAESEALARNRLNRNTTRRI